jgi:hypothetical protein
MAQSRTLFRQSVRARHQAMPWQMGKKSPDDSRIGNGHSSHTEISPGRQAARRRRSGGSISAAGSTANSPTRDSPTRERFATASARKLSLQMRNETRTRNAKRMRNPKQTRDAKTAARRPAKTPWRKAFKRAPRREEEFPQTHLLKRPFPIPPPPTNWQGNRQQTGTPLLIIRKCFVARVTPDISFQKSEKSLQQAALLLCLGKTTPPKTTPPTTAPTT